MRKRYETLLATGAVIAALGLAAPALADTAPGTTNTNPGMHTGWFGGMRGGPGRQMPGVLGTVTAISGDTLTVTQKLFARPDTNNTTNNAPTPTTYTVTATGASVTKNGATASLSDIAVGDTVMVAGTVSGTNVTATAIRDGVVPQFGQHTEGQGPKGQIPASIIQGNGEPIVAGSVTAVNGSALTITNKSNVTYAIDASSATIAKKNATSTVADIAIGDNVIVQGTVNGTNVTASSVIDSGTPPAAGSSDVPHKVMGFFAGIGGFFAHIFGF